MKTARPRRSKSIVLRLALIAFAAYLIVTMGSLQKQLTDKKQELSELSAKHEALVLKNQELSNLLTNGTESDFIERAARDRLGYVYADEDVFKDISGK